MPERRDQGKIYVNQRIKRHAALLVFILFPCLVGFTLNQPLDRMPSAELIFICAFVLIETLASQLLNPMLTRL